MTSLSCSTMTYYRVTILSIWEIHHKAYTHKAYTADKLSDYNWSLNPDPCQSLFCWGTANTTGNTHWRILITWFNLRQWIVNTTKPRWQENNRRQTKYNNLTRHYQLHTVTYWISSQPNSWATTVNQRQSHRWKCLIRARHTKYSSGGHLSFIIHIICNYRVHRV